MVVSSSGFRLVQRKPGALHEYKGGKKPFIAELSQDLDIGILDFEVTPHTKWHTS